MKTLLVVLAIIGGLAILRYLRPKPQVAPAAARQADMSRDEAAAVLGVDVTSPAGEIIEAHKRLMQRVHPDKGGSAHLARQLNEAKWVLLRK